jgi:hypothetical protein
MTAVEDAIICPMVASLPAPTHVRGDPAAVETLLNVYRTALARFDRPVLEQAWQKVAAEQNFWVWPLPETIVRAAEHFHKLAHPNASQEAEAWVERATKLSDDYVKRFMATTQAAVRAREGGYEPALRSYVREASWVQAQYIEGRSGVGYSSTVLFSSPTRDKEAEQRFFSKAKEQAATGHIKVIVPNEMVKRWKTEGEARGR